MNSFIWERMIFKLTDSRTNDLLLAPGLLYTHTRQIRLLAVAELAEPTKKNSSYSELPPEFILRVC